MLSVLWGLLRRAHAIIKTHSMVEIAMALVCVHLTRPKHDEGDYILSKLIINSNLMWILLELMVSVGV